MKICYVLPHFDETKNSFSKLLRPVLDRLLSEGHNFHILSANRNYQGIFKDQHIAAPFGELKPGFLQYLAFLIFSSLWLLKHKGRYDIVHNLGVGTTLVQNLMTAHACHRAWVDVKRKLGQYPSLILNPLHGLVLSVEAINYRRKIPIIAVCQSLADQIAHYYPHAKDRITVIANGIPEQTVSQLPQPDKGLHLSFASNDHGKKGLGELLEALAMSQAEGKDWILNIYGHDKAEGLWQAKVKELKLSTRVIFHGHVTNLPQRLSSSQLFILPSYYEAFGLVYLEAAAAGLAVLGTDVGVYPSLVGQEFEGLPLTLPLSAKALYREIQKVEDDKAYRQRLIQAVQQKAKVFSESRMVDATVKLSLSVALKANKPLPT